MSSDWFSAKCLLGLDGMSNAVQVINRKAQQENWKSRPRKAKGGGKEYHISSLPKETQRALRIRQTKQQQAATTQPADLNNAQLKGALEGMKQAGDEKAEQVRQLSAFNQLSPKEQERIRARTEVMTALEVYIKDFASLNKSITAFIEAYNSNQLDLPAHVKTFVPKVSRANLFRWRSAYASEGPAGLACKYQPVKRNLIDSQPELLAFAEGMLAKMPHTTTPNMLKAMYGNFDGRPDITLPSDRALQKWLSSWKANIFLHLILALIRPLILE